MPFVRHERPEPAPITPARIAASAQRLRVAYARARSHGARVFGPDSEAMRILGERVDALATVAHVTRVSASVAVASFLLDASNAAPALDRVHRLAVWLLAVAGEIEADDGTAAAMAVDLGEIVANCELIASALDANAARAA